MLDDILSPIGFFAGGMHDVVCAIAKRAANLGHLSTQFAGAVHGIRVGQ
jgi:hypothetical protein